MPSTQRGRTARVLLHPLHPPCLACRAGVVCSDVLKLQYRCPSVRYWAASLAMVPATLLVLAGARQYLLRKAQLWGS